MEERLSNFAGYMFFSSMEYLVCILLIFSIFNLEIKYYIKETIITTEITSLLSYFLLVNGVFSIVPSFIIIIFIFVICFWIIYQKKVSYSLVVVIAGSLTYGFVSLLSSSLFSHYNVITVNEIINQSFGLKTYLIQSLNASIGLTVAIYVKLTRGGFGFMFRGHGYKKFITVSVLLLIFLTFVYYSLEYNVSSSVLIGFTISIFVSLLVMLFLSYKRDQKEFS